MKAGEHITRIRSTGQKVPVRLGGPSFLYEAVSIASIYSAINLPSFWAIKTCPNFLFQYYLRRIVKVVRTYLNFVVVLVKAMRSEMKTVENLQQSTFRISITLSL